MGICFSAPAASSSNDDFAANAGPSSSREQLKRQDEKIATILRIAETQVDSSGALSASQGQIEKRYKMGKLLGKGAFGAVQLCTRKPDGYKNGDRPVPGQNVGIKVISKLKFQGDEEYQYMLTEVQLHHKVRGHPNVTELYEYSEDKANFYMVLELATGGELMDRISKMNHFSEKVASRYFKQMASGLSYCHAHGVVHRDLKPENFLMADDTPDADIKITDFGLAASIENQDSVMHDACGSAFYIAPEMFSKSFTKAVDAWSLGVNLYLFLSGKLPFGAECETENDVYEEIKTKALDFSGAAWRNISPAAIELLQGLLDRNPVTRYSMEQALAHPWVAGDAAPDTALSRDILSSLSSFNARNKFKKNALKIIASKLSASDVAALREAFLKIDKDHSGFITYAEMQDTLSSMGMNDDAASGIVKNVDADGDGRISYEEFLHAALDKQMINHQNTIWWAFCEYDIDGDGKITLEELRRVLKGETDENIKKYIAEYDLDQSGCIEYEEFARMLLPVPKKERTKTSSSRRSGVLPQER